MSYQEAKKKYAVLGVDPEKAILRGADFYRAKGYTEGWINQRLQTIEMRKKLTDEWKERGVKEGVEYAMLTDEMTKAWSGLTVKEYKELKGLKNNNKATYYRDIAKIYLIREDYDNAFKYLNKYFDIHSNNKDINRLKKKLKEQCNKIKKYK